LTSRMEEIMKNMALVKKIGLGVFAFSVNVAPLWASDAPQEGSSDMFVWIFLAFCALVVVAQLIPAMMMLFGFAKGVKKSKLESAPDPVADHLTSPKR
jgi:hypothetical protein